VTEECIKLHKEELNYLYCSPDIVENEMDGESFALGGEVHTVFWWGNLMERDHLEDPGVDGCIILRGIFR
jgi:hypothetical protein